MRLVMSYREFMVLNIYSQTSKRRKDINVVLFYQKNIICIVKTIVVVNIVKERLMKRLKLVNDIN